MIFGKEKGHADGLFDDATALGFVACVKNIQFRRTLMFVYTSLNTTTKKKKQQQNSASSLLGLFVVWKIFLFVCIYFIPE